MSVEERIEALEERYGAFNMLASVFLELPTAEGVEALRALPLDEVDPKTPLGELARFVEETRDQDVEDVLLDIARDRVLLIRGAGIGAIVPPYESLYAKINQNDVVGSLNRFFNECGVEKVADVHDTADQMGVELAFVAELLAREISQVKDGDIVAADETEAAIERFMGAHLSRWAGLWADVALEAAHTGYYRAMASFVREIAGTHQAQ